MPFAGQLRQGAPGRKRLAEEKSPSGAQRALGHDARQLVQQRKSRRRAAQQASCGHDQPRRQRGRPGQTRPLRILKDEQQRKHHHAARRVAYAPLQRPGHQIAQRRSCERRRPIQPSRHRRDRRSAEGRQLPHELSRRHKEAAQKMSHRQGRNPHKIHMDPIGPLCPVLDRHNAFLRA